jgi:hypothetical protein
MNTVFISEALTQAFQNGHRISGRVTKNGRKCWFGVEEKKCQIMPGCPVLTPRVGDWDELGEIKAHPKARGLSDLQKLQRTAAALIEAGGVKGVVPRWTTIKIELF